jgi:hypothetical protein
MAERHCEEFTVFESQFETRPHENKNKKMTVVFKRSRERERVTGLRLSESVSALVRL